MKKTKSYRLLPRMAPTAPIYVQTGDNSKVRVDVLKRWDAHLQYSIVTPEGKGRVARLKIGASSIWLDEQIKEGFPANEKFTEAERMAVRFRYGRLDADIPIVQEFLENIPHYAGFQGTSLEGFDASHRAFEIYAKDEANKSENEAIRQRIAAAQKIMKMTLPEAHEMLIRIQGTFVELPEDVYEAQNILINLTDDSYEALEEVLKDDKQRSQDSRIAVIVGKAINKGIISFSSLPNSIALKMAGKWIPVKEISNEYETEQREMFFIEFLGSKAGEPLLETIEKEVGEDQETETFVPIQNDGTGIQASTQEPVKQPVTANQNEPTRFVSSAQKDEASSLTQETGEGNENTGSDDDKGGEGNSTSNENQQNNTAANTNANDANQQSGKGKGNGKANGK